MSCILTIKKFMPILTLLLRLMSIWNVYEHLIATYYKNFTVKLTKVSDCYTIAYKHYNFMLWMLCQYILMVLKMVLYIIISQWIISELNIPGSWHFCSLLYAYYVKRITLSVTSNAAYLWLNYSLKWCTSVIWIGQIYAAGSCQSQAAYRSVLHNSLYYAPMSCYVFCI